MFATHIADAEILSLQTASTNQSMGFSGGARGKEPASQRRRHETWIRSLGQKDPLEESMAIHSSILAWKNATDRGVHGVAQSPTGLKGLSGAHARTHY